MKNVVLKIDGMTCVGCENRIQKKLNSLKGVLNVRANYNSSTVSVKYNENIVSLAIITRAIESLHYKVDVTGGAIDGDKFSVTQLLGIGIIVFALYFVINSTVGFNFIPAVSENMGIPILFIIGLITSLHCIAMCGGINLSQCVRVKQDDHKSGFKKLMPSILYNLGRVISYTIIGGIVGALGSVVRFSGMASGIVAVFAGIFMIVMALNMLNVFPVLRKISPRMPKMFSGLQGKAAGKGPFIVGLLNGMMPCGPLQAMQIYALGTGSFFKGALAMFAFSLGTVPLMFGFGAISSFLSSKFTKRMMKVSAVLVMGLGIIMLSRGFSLSGISLFSSASANSTASVMDGSGQVVETNFTANDYAPIIVKTGVPVKWNIQIKSEDLNGCNRTMVIPSLGISKTLVAGNNIVEFTPNSTGIINYSCSMGMIRSTIEVVDELATTSTTVIAETEVTEADTTATDNSGIAKIENNKQEVVITVNSSGYSPETVVLQKGIPAKIKFVLSGQLSCSSYVILPTLNEQLDLTTTSETKEFIPSGDFSYSCGMGMYNGFVEVVDDIKNIK